MPINIYDFNSKTDLENFNHIIALNLDEMKSFIDEVSDNLSVEFVDQKYFGIIASLLNVQLDKSEDQYLQRQQLRTALDTIRSKGTLECFKVLMYNFGLEIDIIPLWTPDYYEELEITPPYIVIDGNVFLNMKIPIDLYTVRVMNPDSQLDTFENSFTVTPKL
jgi:hypothetical protein